MNYLPLNAIRAFEAAARRLSFSAAGNELNVTHAAISHQIRLLEEWLDVRLFTRGRRVELTEAGSMLFDSAGMALRDLNATCQRIRRNAGGTTSVTVGCIPSIAARWLVPRLSAFTNAHPHIGVRVVYAKADERLSDSDNDVLITLGEDPSPGVSSLRLFSRINLPVCSPHYRARHGGLATTAGIAAADLLHDETRQGWRDWIVAAGLSDTGPAKGPVFADANILATAVIAGHGVALCPVEVFREEIRRGDLVVLSDIATNTDKGYYLTMAAKPPHGAQAFATWFQAEVTPA